MFIKFLQELAKLDGNKSAWANTFVFIGAMVVGFQYAQHEIVKPLQESMYVAYTKDTYKIVQYDLSVTMKHLREGTPPTNPITIKKFHYFCGGYFGKTFAKTLPYGQFTEVESSCEVIGQLYKDLILKG